jgi:uncharacterized protein
MSAGARPECHWPNADRRVEIRSGPERGRGVFAREPIAAGTMIEMAPVIVVQAVECRMLDQTILHDYYFHWDGDPDGEGRGAIGLGLVSLCNHSSQPCARADRNLAQQTLDLVVIADIEAGTEVTIDYGCELWFEPSD